MAMVPLLIIPFMLLSGFFLNLDQYHDIRVIFYPVMYLSPFKYGYQAGMIALKQTFDPYSPNTFELNIIILIGLGFILRLIACLVMMKISNPKRPKMGKLP
jgi:ATP-binding cassette, subfamily G (WHITE), eye pigment precursor transporter